MENNDKRTVESAERELGRHLAELHALSMAAAGGASEDDWSSIVRWMNDAVSHAVEAIDHARFLEKAQREAARTRHDAYCDVVAEVPEFGAFVRVSEGTGDNLLPEDIKRGFEDYVYYDILDEMDGEVVDGGIVLLRRPLREAYGRIEDCIPDVLAIHYGKRDAAWSVVRCGEE